MKKNKVLVALLLSLGLLVMPIASNFAYETNNNYVVAMATPEDKEQFLIKFELIRTLQRNEGRSVCDTTKEEYEELVAYYYDLSKEEKAEVNAMQDPTNLPGEDYTIGDVMKEIVRLFYTPQTPNSSNKKRLDQKTTIIISVVVSIIGMSAISVLFILKNNKFIE